MKLKKRWENPRLVPEMQHEQVKWLRREGGKFWIYSGLDGTQFYVPQEVREHSRALAQSTLRQRRQQLEVVTPDMVKEHQYQSELFSLAEWSAATWDNATLFSVTPSMTMKASRTGMTEFYLPSSMLPSDSGVIFFQRPIGVAEHFNPTTEYEIDPETGVLSPVTYFSLYNVMMDESQIPVVAASWRKLTDGRVYLAFWTDSETAVHAIRDLTAVERRERLAKLPPLQLEREQVVPLDQKVPWFTSDADNRLVPTARGRAKDSRTLILAKERSFQGLPMLEQMVRTFTATLLYMRNVQDHREIVHAPKSTAKRMRQEGAPEHISSGGVTIVKMGEPLRYKAPRRKEDAEWHWTERRVVEPYFRYRQYIPATGETREGIFEVSGYIAGPPDAPIRNIDKVFLLGDN